MAGDTLAPFTVWATNMVYAIFMLLVLLTLLASWRKHHVLELALFAITVTWVLVHLVGDMTTPLPLSF